MIARAAVLALLLAAQASAATPEEYRAFAVEQAKLHVPGTMKNPRSAEFDDESVQSVPLVDWGNGKTVWMQVGGTVRGTNTFNAVVPSSWSASVAEIDGELQIGIITLSGKVIHAGKASDLALLEIKRVIREQGAKTRAKIEAGAAESAAASERDKAAMRQEAGRIRAALKVEDEAQAAQADRARVDTIRRQGRRDGYAAVSATGKARGRLTDAEIKKRSKAAAAKAGFTDADAEAYASGFMSGALVAKAGQSLTD
jgi:hypothetical protein